MIMQSYQAMGPEGRKRLRIVGGCMIAFGIGMPMVAELFVLLSWVYWVFAGFVALTGICLLWPEMGILLLNVIPNIVARFWPRGADKMKPERREPRE
jgi:hypothetical protein